MVNPKLIEMLAQIAENPSILGLGDLVSHDKQRAGPRVGLPGLLLEDPGTQRRYTVNLQLGSTDEPHIIRTIENWDIERKRSPQYDHCAVLVAGDISSRFLNVLALLNGTIPLIAIQMKVLSVGGHSGVVFRTVMDETTRPPV